MVAIVCRVTALPDWLREDLILYYFHQGYTWKEICAFLLLVHNIFVTPRLVKRIAKRLNLRKRNVSSPLPDVVRALDTVYERGYSNAGYRTVWKAINSTTNVRANQETVRRLLKIIDTEGVELRSRHRLRRRTYINKGPNYLIHVDGYDKMKPFGVAIHGAVDGFSRKVLWLEASYSNNDPKIVAWYFLECVKRIGGSPRLVRGDAGTENVLIKDLQIALRYHCTDGMAAERSYLTGRSTSNQPIERFWTNLKEHFTVFWRNFFRDLVDLGVLKTDDPVHLECVRFCFLPIIQSDLDRFAHLWNLHRIRQQRNSELPCGIPDVMYDLPELFDSKDYSFPWPCDLETIEGLQNVYTVEKPKFGCKELFIQLIEELTGIQREHLPQADTLETAIHMFLTLTEVLDNL